jgi:hypothetical protein
VTSAELKNDRIKLFDRSSFFLRSEDDNFVAFVEVTSFIEGHNVVEEFLACGLWPLGKQFGFRVEIK